jgi:hypothetical protein
VRDDLDLGPADADYPCRHDDSVLVGRDELLRLEAAVLPQPPLKREELAQPIVSAKGHGVDWTGRCVYLDVRLERPEIDTGRAAEARVVENLVSASHDLRVLLGHRLLR